MYQQGIFISIVHAQTLLKLPLQTVTLECMFNMYIQVGFTSGYYRQIDIGYPKEHFVIEFSKPICKFF